MIKICSISNKYIEFLSKNTSEKYILKNVGNNYINDRRYLGVLVNKTSFNYFIPFSSPKNTDFIDRQKNIIRKNTLSIIRMKNKDTLLGTLKINNMIPVPKEEIEYYDFSKEINYKYKDLMINELNYINKNYNTIARSANTVYYEKVNKDRIYINKEYPKYLDATVDFKLAEYKCLEYTFANNLTYTDEQYISVVSYLKENDMLQELDELMQARPSKEISLLDVHINNINYSLEQLKDILSKGNLEIASKCDELCIPDKYIDICFDAGLEMIASSGNEEHQGFSINTIEQLEKAYNSGMDIYCPDYEKADAVIEEQKKLLAKIEIEDIIEKGIKL